MTGRLALTVIPSGPTLTVCMAEHSRHDPEGIMGPFDRITQTPDMMGGKPCIRGMRVTVGMIVGQIGAGHSVDDVLAAYPYLEKEDVLQALQYAAWRTEERDVVLAGE